MDQLLLMFLKIQSHQKWNELA